MPSIMLILGSLPLGMLSSATKCAVRMVIRGPLILIGTTPLCLGGILMVDLMVSNSGFLGGMACVKVKNLPFFLHVTLLVLVPSIR